MPKMSIKSPSASRADKDKALQAVSSTHEDEPLTRLPVDVPASHKRKLKTMAANSIEDIPYRLLVIEALEDLFAKYDKGKGRYRIAKR